MQEEVLAEIKKGRTLWDKFQSWETEQQEEFLDICTGAKRLKLLYDGFCACYSADLLLRQYKLIITFSSRNLPRD